MIQFTVITVCLNAGDALAETVRRTLAQTYPNFEILVKDGFSTDGSVEKLPEDPRVRLVQRKDTGIYDAMNQAAGEARGEYIIFMNAGDWFYDDTVLEKMAAMLEESRPAIAYGNCFYRTAGEVRSYPKSISRLTCYRTMICHQATVYRADVLREHPYDLSYRIIADRELLWYLVCRKGEKPFYLDMVIADYQGGGESAKPEHIRRNKEDQKRLKDTYYPRSEQFKYDAMMVLSMQKLRIRWSKHPKYGKYYHAMIRGIYRLKGK